MFNTFLETIRKDNVHRDCYLKKIVHYLRFLEYTLDSTKIRAQDVKTVLEEVSRNPAGRLPAWHMVRQHWSQISQLFGQGSFTLGGIIRAVTSSFTSAFDLSEVSSPVIWILGGINLQKTR